MRKPGTDETDVQMTDVLCDFCHREWTADVPMLEGHQGSCVCGRCLTLAYADVVVAGRDTAPGGYTCPMCLEAAEDRAALNRAGEPGWQSPVVDDAVMCRRCIKLAAGALEKDKDLGWKRPGKKNVSA